MFLTLSTGISALTTWNLDWHNQLLKHCSLLYSLGTDRTEKPPTIIAAGNNVPTVLLPSNGYRTLASSHSRYLAVGLHFTTTIPLSLALCLIVWYYFWAGPPLWSGGKNSWLQIQRFRVRFPALPDFLRSNAFGTACTQPGEYNWGATLKK
jgi:hypothetical protein